MEEQLISVIVNVVSSVLYDLGKYAKNFFPNSSQQTQKKREEELVRQLQDELERFLKKHEEYQFLDSDWFADSIKYQRIIERICNYVGLGYEMTDRNGNGISKQKFLDRLVADTEPVGMANGEIERVCPFGAIEKSVVKELYQMLIDTVQGILNQQMSVADKYVLTQVVQNIWQANQILGDELKERLAGEKKKFSEKAYEYPEPHIKRFCCSQERRLTRKEEPTKAFQLTEICQKYSQVVVLGEAGSGKSTELQWVSAYYSNEKSLPRPVFLTLKTYIDETIQGLAEKQGFFIDKEEHLLLIIDGFDEISGGNRQNFLKQLTAYQEQNPKVNLLISARNHFYREGILGDSFQAVWIEPLHLKAALTFVREFGLDEKAFVLEVGRQNLNELLQIPFYLIELCNIYREMGRLPKRSQLMKTLIEHKFDEDLKKFRTTEETDLSEKKPQIFLLLQKIAAAMYAMNRYSLEEREYQRLISNPNDRNLLRYSGIWKFQEGTWQFTHNNFGEYLAAEYLLQCPLEKVKVLVSAGYPELGICKNWHHVLSYLISISEDSLDKDMEQWLLTQDFTLFLGAEADRILPKQRSKILREEWRRLKQKNEWITFQKYRVTELVNFGVGYAEVLMFLDEIRKPTDIIAQQNAIFALSACSSLFGLDEEIRDALLAICKAPQEYKCLYERAILGLLEMELMGNQEFEWLIEHFRDEDSSEVRYALYRSISSLGKADEQIQFLVDGLTYVYQNTVSGQMRLGNESAELHYAMMEVSTVTAAMEILKALTNHKEYFHIYEIDRVVEHIFSQWIEQELWLDGDDWYQIVKFYETVSDFGQYKIEEILLHYVTVSGYRIKLFQEQMRKGINNIRSWMIIRNLLDDTVAEWILEQYACDSIEQEWVRWCMDSMNQESEVFAKLAALYTEKTGLPLADKPKADGGQTYQKGKERYQQAITCKEAYVGLIEELLRFYGKEELTEKDMEKQSGQLWQKHYDLEEVRLDYCRTNDIRTVQEWKNDLEQGEWEEFEGYLIMKWLRLHEKDNLPEEVCIAARQYFDIYIEEEDFFKSVKGQGDIWYQETSIHAPKLLYFAWRLGFSMDKEKAKGIFSAAGLMDERKIKELLERHFTKDELREIVQKNMAERELDGDELELHLLYCIELEIKQCAEQIRKIAVDGARPDWIRERAIRYFRKVIGSEVLCQVVLPHLEGQIFLYGVNQAIEEEPDGLGDLLWEYAEKDERYRIYCYGKLIRLQDVRGLKAYRLLLEQEGKIQTDIVYNGPLEYIGQIKKEELLEEVNQLVRLWLRPDFEDAQFRGLAFYLGGALAGIAGNKEHGYRKLKEFLEEEMASEQMGFSKKVQLNEWLSVIQESYKQSVQRVWSFDQAEKELFCC